MDDVLYFVLGLGGPALAVFWALTLTRRINAADRGTDAMIRISDQIRAGAMAFLRTEYTYLAVFVVVVFVLLGVFIPDHGWGTAVSFAIGATASGVAGWIGMRTATAAAVRTTQAARTSLSSALTIAFSSGAVMGLTVVALGVAGITLLYVVFGRTSVAADTIFGFSLGASSIALFARVGGGIFTKAADVGADLVGKVEAGIPEDDPRNPAVIADNVGDNVGDVAGMGADLFESYVGCIISSIVLAWAMTEGVAGWDLGDQPWDEVRSSLTLFPVILAGLGIICSVAGTFVVRTENENKIHSALERGLLVASGLVLLGAFALVTIMGLPIQVLWAVVSGLVAGVLIGKVTHHYTAKESSPVRHIAQQSRTGPATTIIAGLGVGMMSCAAPVILICGAIYLSYDLAGLYGIAIAAVGMLSTLGISLGVDAYGPVADNAGGIAEMSHCPPEVRQRTDALDAVGNTTAAVGKGFAIGSAALTALAFFAAFQQAFVKAAAGDVALLSRMSLELSNPKVLIGLLLGGTLPFVFSALTMNAVGRAANRMIEEVRRQFRTIPGLMEGKAEPDSETCVAIATSAAIREMIIPGLLAVVSPVAVGLLLGVSGLAGLLGGALVTGVLMAIMMANAGGAWDNAKKYIEDGHEGGKGSDTHKAAVIGDTVGDPFKDTSGPSLNILVKLMSVVAVIVVPIIVEWMR
jgi:K(+)-stimulated pyrophosphate-energized sodium pump